MHTQYAPGLSLFNRLTMLWFGQVPVSCVYVCIYVTVQGNITVPCDFKLAWLCNPNYAELGCSMSENADVRLKLHFVASYIDQLGRSRLLAHTHIHTLTHTHKHTHTVLSFPVLSVDQAGLG